MVIKGVMVFTTTLGYTMLVVEENEELIIDLIISWSKSSGVDLKVIMEIPKKFLFSKRREFY